MNGHDLTLEKAEKLSRKDMIAWLEWNDRHGVYNDVESKKEFGTVATRSELLGYIKNQLGAE